MYFCGWCFPERKGTVNFFLRTVDDDKVPLFPVNNAEERHFIAQLLPGQPVLLGTEADILGSLTDAQHGYPGLGNIGTGAQVLQGISFSVIHGDHPKAGRTGVHRI